MITIFPYSVWDCQWLAPCVLALDLMFGDPRLPWPHPVTIPGKLMHILERPARKFMNGGILERQKKFRGLLAGFVALSLSLILTGCACWLLLAIPGLSTLFAVYLAWAGLAMGCLLRTGKIVLDRVENAPIEEGRKACAWLVSRDVSQMDRHVLRKTLADTLSENFTDAFVAPFFWLLLTGPIGLWLYKTVSTMDSQWGYLTPEWRYLGFAGARSDDILAWLPGRISVVLLYLTNKIVSHLPPVKSWTGSFPHFKIIASQAKGMPSPNSGWPMAACAWLCNGRMAGSSIYFGKLVQKPWLGPPETRATPWDCHKLLVLCKLLFYSSLIGGLTMWFVAWLASWPLR